jgi:hypothetical protein
MIYLLKRADEIGWDEYEGKIVRASSEQEARDIANQKTGDEGQIWSNPERVTCEPCDAEGASGALLEAFRAG